MYLILLREPLDGKMQVETDNLIANKSGVILCSALIYAYEVNQGLLPDYDFIPTSNIDSIIVKPE